MLRCEGLNVTFEETQALRDVALELAAGETVAVMGESGSGKSTLLRVIAGLVAPDSGSVVWNDHDITDRPTHLRHFGLMFQDYALFPHLDVAANVAFGLRMRGVGSSQSAATTRRMLQLVGLAGYESRQIHELSGGEQQRVALARTLAPEPNLVLLDEPLGALDRARRDQLLADMQRIFASLGVATMYVTHDHAEAFAIADRVVVLEHGRKVADAAPRRLWNDPQHPAVATLLGFPILRAVKVVAGKAVISGVEIEADLTAGTYDLAMAPGGATVDAAAPIEAVVTATRFEDGMTKAIVDVDGVEMVADAPHGATPGPARIRIDGRQLRRVSEGSVD